MELRPFEERFDALRREAQQFGEDPQSRYSIVKKVYQRIGRDLTQQRHACGLRFGQTLSHGFGLPVGIALGLAAAMLDDQANPMGESHQRLAERLRQTAELQMRVRI